MTQTRKESHTRYPRPGETRSDRPPAVPGILPLMAPTDWTASSPEEFEKLQSELRALTEDDRTALDELGQAIATIKDAKPVADREDWVLPEYARQHIWATVESHMNGGGDDTVELG